MNLPKVTTSARMPSLDGLRAVSLCSILIGHLAGSRNFVPPSYLAPLNIGDLGVRVFFVVSGFLITTLLMKEMRDSGHISLPMFYLRRTLRIFPAFYVFLIAIAILAGAHRIRLLPGDLLHAATYTSNYHVDRSWWAGHIWSLSVEEQFYLLWPVVFAFAGLKKSMRTAGAVVLLCPIIRVGLLLMYPGRNPWMNELFPTVADGLATGCLLAGFRHRLAGMNWYQRLQNSRWFNLVPALALIMNCIPGGRIRFAILLTLMNLCLAATVDRYVSLPATWTGRVLNSRPFVYVGTLSYSLYLWQQLFLHHEQSVFPFPVNLLLAIGMAWISYNFVEVPFLKLRRNIERRIRAGRVVAPLSPAYVAGGTSGPC